MQKVCDVGRYLTVILVDCFADMRYYLTGKVAFNVITIMSFSPICAQNQIPWILSNFASSVLYLFSFYFCGGVVFVSVHQSKLKSL